MEGKQRERDRLRAQRQAAETQDTSAAQARKRRVQVLTIAAFAAAAAIVALVIVISQSSGGNSSPPSSISGVPQVAAQLTGLDQSGTVLGKSTAPVTVIEYGDPQCSSCKFFSENVAPQLISSDVRTGQAKYEFRPYLIIGPDSKPAARAALAAGDQDRFWQYLQLFYLNQGAENSGYVTDSFLTDLAKAAAVPDLPAWNADRSSSKWDAVIQRGSNQAESFGFTGTPSIVVQGPKGQKPIGGSTIPSFQQVQAAIQQVG
jgi:protein-disulfide isomerase